MTEVGDAVRMARAMMIESLLSEVAYERDGNAIVAESELERRIRLLRDLRDHVMTNSFIRAELDRVLEGGPS